MWIHRCIYSLSRRKQIIKGLHIESMALGFFFVFQNLPKNLNYKQICQLCCLSTSSLEKGRQEVVIQPVQVLYVPIGWKNLVNTSSEGNGHTAHENIENSLKKRLRLLIEFFLQNRRADSWNMITYMILESA